MASRRAPGLSESHKGATTHSSIVNAAMKAISTLAVGRIAAQGPAAGAGQIAMPDQQPALAADPADDIHRSSVATIFSGADGRRPHAASAMP